MKKILSLLFPVLYVFYPSAGQVPEGFNYQAIARDPSGSPITNSALPVMITIQSDSLGGTVFWEELHPGVSTNAYGLFTLVIGKGSKQSGQALLFNEIDWSVSPKFIKTQVNYGGWKTMGSSRLLTVPYAMVAKDLSGTLKKLAVTGSTLSMEEALFEVKNISGQTVFAVYNEGVRIYVSDGAKASKGGFAVGSFSNAKATPQDFFIVSSDSIRAYIDTNPAKALKGGFAVSSFNLGKAADEEYLRVTRDSTRIYVRESQKGLKGGFAVGSFAGVKSSTENYLNLTPDNYFIGHQSGRSTTLGLYNNFMGYEAGFFNTEGNNNSFMGYYSGRSNLTGNSNTFVGNSSGASNISGSNNTFVGTSTGLGFKEGSSNTFQGVLAGGNFLNGNYNIFIGYAAGYGFQFPVATAGGQNNVAIGNGAGFRLITGNDNIFIGNLSGFNNVSGSQNTILGFKAGYTNSSGVNNIFVGNQAGYSNTSGFDNTFLGFQSGFSNQVGYANVFIGKNAGYTNLNGYQNVFIGEQAGNKNTSGSQNTFLGLQAGNNNTIGGGNVFVGWNAGLLNTQGSNNSFFGLGAGYNNTTAGYNTFIGFSAGLANQAGTSNTYLGSNAGRSNISGSGNTIIGDGAAASTATGNYNTIIGFDAAASLTGGGNNVFIGAGAGGSETNASDRLYIENSAADYTGALIYGDFANDYLRFNASVDMFNRLHFPNTGAALFVANTEALWYNGTYYSWGFGGTYNYFARPVSIGTTANPGSTLLYVAGNATVTGTFTNPSDERYKSDIYELQDVLSRVNNMRGVQYTWKTDEFPGLRFEPGIQLGFIAQEVEKLFPELVETDNYGYKSLDYSRMSVVLVQAVKEQQTQIMELDQKIQRLEQIISNLEKIIVSSSR